ncbi:MAG: hypothetical protein Q8Q08_11850 [Candidatus Omnitrophota bacterium]|nr:hypothetical protein [Candidatus Omnitrophota bacterium]
MKAQYAIIVVLLAFLGCATTQKTVQNVFRLDSSGLNASCVRIACSRNLGQEGVEGHLIKVDDADL